MASDKNQQERERQERERQEQQPPGHGEAARTPQGDHTPRQEEQRRREEQERRQAGRRQEPTAEQRQAAEQRDAQQREAMAAASIGAQIILDYNEPASQGARGGAGGSIEENTLARDTHLAALGLDPVSPSGPPPTPEQLAARRRREEADAKAAADPQFVAPASGKASRMSSLAAGINAGDLPPPTEPAAPASH